MEQGNRYFVINLVGSKVVNSIGISILIEIIEKILEVKGKLAFCGLTPTISKDVPHHGPRPVQHAPRIRGRRRQIGQHACRLVQLTVADDPQEHPSNEASRALLGLDSLAELADSLADFPDFREGARTFLRQVLGTLLASKGAVYLYDPRAGRLDQVASRGIEARWIGVASDEVSRLAALRDPVRGSDLGLEGVAADDLVAPLGLQGQLLGLLQIGPKFMGHDYGSGDLGILKVIALNTSVALFSQGLVRTARETSMKLRQKVLEMETLRDVGLEISALTDLESSCRDILERAVALIAPRAGLLVLYDDGRSTFEAAFRFGATEVADEVSAEARPWSLLVEAHGPVVDLAADEVAAFGGDKERPGRPHPLQGSPARRLDPPGQGGARRG